MLDYSRLYCGFRDRKYLCTVMQYAEQKNLGILENTYKIGRIALSSGIFIVNLITVLRVVASVGCRCSVSRVRTGVIKTSFSAIGGLEDLKAAHERLVDRHHGGCVVEFSTIVWRREHRDEFPSCEELISIFDYLVGANNEIQLMLAKKLFDDIFPICEADASIIVSPTIHALARIRPYDITQETGVWHVRGATDILDLIKAS